MKKLELFINPDKLQEVEQILSVEQIEEFMLSKVMRYRKGNSLQRTYRGVTLQTEMKELVKIEVFVPESSVKVLDMKLKDCVEYMLVCGE